MRKLTQVQKREVDSIISRNDLCNLIIYLNSLNEERNLDTLKETFATGKRYFWKKLDKAQRKSINDIMGTANLLYLDLDGAAEHFIQSANVTALEQVRELGLLYGRYNAVKRISEYGALHNHEGLRIGGSDYDEFLFFKVLPHITLERDGDEFFFKEDLLEEVFADAGQVDRAKIFKNVVERMYKEGSLDAPRKLLSSLYSKDTQLIKKARREFKARLGKRKNIDDVVEKICTKKGFELVQKIQQGDDDDFYPLSAHLYLLGKRGKRFVLKENIRYKIDFSSLDGYNMELELYSDKLRNAAVPKYMGRLKSKGLEFILLECVRGEQLTRHTDKENLLPTDNVLDVVGKLAQFLDYMHSNGIVYADMKDKNVMYDGENVKVLDFGMASTRLYQEVGSGEEFVYEVISNAEYACPETIMMSRVYKTSDIFQLGIMFYKLLTGKHPFADGKATEDYTERESELVAFSLANLWNKPSFDDDVFVENPELTELVAGMLDKDYTRRPYARDVCYSLEELSGNTACPEREK